MDPKDEPVSNVSVSVALVRNHDWDLTEVGRLYDRISGRLPGVTSRSDLQLMQLPEREQSLALSFGTHAVALENRFRSEDGAFTLVVSPYRLTLEYERGDRVYCGWEDIRDLFFFCIEKYSEVTSEDEVRSCELEYENHWEIAAPTEAEGIVAVGPVAPDDMTDGLTSSIAGIRRRSHDESREGIVQITARIDPEDESGFRLTLHLLSETDFKPSGSFEVLGPAFEKMHAELLEYFTIATHGELRESRE